jgi:hypothetical protein
VLYVEMSVRVHVRVCVHGVGDVLSVLSPFFFGERPA